MVESRTHNPEVVPPAGGTPATIPERPLFRGMQPVHFTREELLATSPAKELIAYGEAFLNGLNPGHCRVRLRTGNGGKWLWCRDQATARRVRRALRLLRFETPITTPRAEEKIARLAQQMRGCSARAIVDRFYAGLLRLLLSELGF